MRMRRQKKAFRKLIDHRSFSRREMLAGLHYSVRRYGAVAGPMMAVTIKGMTTDRDEAARIFSGIYLEWIRTNKLQQLPSSMISEWRPTNLSDN